MYYNGKIIANTTVESYTDFENGNSVLRSAFVIGQEQDTLAGGYDPAQLFNGEISEVNI